MNGKYDIFIESCWSMLLNKEKFLNRIIALVNLILRLSDIFECVAIYNRRRQKTYTEKEESWEEKAFYCLRIFELDKVLQLAIPK